MRSGEVGGYVGEKFLWYNVKTKPTHLMDNGEIWVNGAVNIKNACEKRKI